MLTGQSHTVRNRSFARVRLGEIDFSKKLLSHCLIFLLHFVMSVAVKEQVEDCRNCTICKGADHFLEKHYLRMDLSLVRFLKEDTELFTLCQVLSKLFFGVTLGYYTVAQVNSGLNKMLKKMEPHLVTNFTVHVYIMAMCWADTYRPKYDYTQQLVFMKDLQLVFYDYVHHGEPLFKMCENCRNEKCRGHHELDNQRALKMCQNACDMIEAALQTRIVVAKVEV